MSRIRSGAIAVLLLAAAGCGGRESMPAAGPAAHAGPYAGVPEVLEDSMLRFPGGATYAPRVYGLRYVATMRDAGGAPVLLVSGAECNACDAPRLVYLRAPGRPLPPPETDTLGVFAHPGLEVDYTDGETPLTATTLFYGECLDGRGPAVLQFATVYDDSGTPTLPPKLTAYLTELARDGLRDSELKPRPDSAAVLTAVAAGLCREVPGEKQLSPP